MIAGTELLEALPVAVYMTDPEGWITFFNEAAAELWGHRPETGSTRWCGSYRLLWPDGRPMAYEDSPMAQSLRRGEALRGIEAIAERPDGSRVPFMAYPALLRSATGEVTSAVNLLVDMRERKQADLLSAHLAAIVSSSDDAIISKSLEGRIRSWNAGATRILGYEPEEMIGESILKIIPPELHKEEDMILSKLRRGEHIDHYDTVRVTKDGRRLDISLTVSPLRDSAGNIVGASKVARDITERKRSEELQRLLFDELNHRVKNTLAMIQAIASQSLRMAASPREFVTSFNGRVQALARAHNLLVSAKMKGSDLAEIIREQVVLGSSDGSRIRCSGPFIMLDARSAVQIALVLHELATNARKYGALSVPSGQLSIEWSLETHSDRVLVMEWRESGVAGVRVPNGHGFGTTLIERTLRANGGFASIDYRADGIVCELRLPLPEEDPGGAIRHFAELPRALARDPAASGPGPVFKGKRILVVEDEPLVALEMEALLDSIGCEIVGPAGTVGDAMKLVARARPDAALLDVNLAGRSADSIAAELTKRGIPFAFATGYGREGLPGAFKSAALVPKPLEPDQLTSTLMRLLDHENVAAGIVPFRPKKK
ncbi:PAS domain S-box protein [Propylenella binzhouense]|uniref:Blue-light-activated histidine kinase n=1 Tax=Propylenella binzhouense TaxID=2555902 RepID=A0A964T8C5_9HYPH|nr:PAS domain S-box protein [Propylenella binzhouense]MYZ50334.1 PAS domain S-box protein [Propylenella binzhouense]